MTDTAIIALTMSGAGVTIVVAGAMLWLSYNLRDAKDDVARYQTQCATLTESNKAKDAALATMAADLTSAKERCDALDAQYQKLAASRPVAGAFSVLQAEAAAAHSSASVGDVAVSDGTPTDDAGPDGLLKPGQ